MEVPQSRLLPLLNNNSQRASANGSNEVSVDTLAKTSIADDFSMMSLTTPNSWYNSSSENSFDVKSSRQLVSNPGIGTENGSLPMSQSSNLMTNYVRSSGHQAGFAPASHSFVNSTPSRSIGVQLPQHVYHTSHMPNHQSMNYHQNVQNPPSVSGLHYGHSKFNYSPKTVNNNVIPHHTNPMAMNHLSPMSGGMSPSSAQNNLTNSPNAQSPNAAVSCYLSSDLQTDVFNKSIELFGHVSEYQQVTAALTGSTYQSSIPFNVGTYKYVCPLEATQFSNGTKSNVFGLVTSCYSAIDSRDGQKYFLRRVHNFRPATSKVNWFIEAWKRVSHPNLVKFKEVFTTREFNDPSTIFVYDYLPSVTTLCQRIISTTAAANPTARNSGSVPKILFPETLVWNYIVQLTSAMRAVFHAGLACRSIDVTKILVDSHNRLYLNGTCVQDVLLCEHSPNITRPNDVVMIQQQQQDDMKNLGKVTMALACGSVMALLPENFKSSYDLIFTGGQFSDDLRNFINYIFTNVNVRKSLNELMPMIGHRFVMQVCLGARFYAQFEASELKCDQLERELVKQVHNSRLMRLMAKLASINERPEFNLDSSWSETGDRYLLKLFRDHVFHQVTEDGAPWLDISHIINCLNKLDCGVDEKILLVSRDNQNALVVTYADLRMCLENSFTELSNPTLTRATVDVNAGSGAFMSAGGGVDRQNGLLVQGQQQQQTLSFSAAGSSSVGGLHSHGSSAMVGGGDAAMTSHHNSVTVNLAPDATNVEGHGGIMVNGIGGQASTATIHMQAAAMYNGTV